MATGSSWLPWKTWHKLALWVAVVLALALGFMLYLQPEFMIRMADQVWACF